MTTVGSAEAAENLARSIVDGRLAACVQLVAIRSVYRWDGELCAEQEWRCEAKTTGERVRALTEHIRTNL
jgi:periplasmic divalent cation tolerance protein